MNINNNQPSLTDLIKKLPALPGVYLFKDEHGQIVYIGKAKNLKKRVMQYIQQQDRDLKADSIISGSTSLDHIVTKTELEAMLLEAQLIQSNQPKFNVLLKSGQPFLYIVITSTPIPDIKLVRHQKQKGSYFGPFLEKTSARKVFDFLVKTFRLRRCNKKIENGCLYYHMGLCSGSCRPDFNSDEYKARMELAKTALKQGHAKFLEQLTRQIQESNQLREFEKSRELHTYLDAFKNVFDALDVHSSITRTLAKKEIWILSKDQQTLMLFDEQNSVFKKKQAFYFPFLTSELLADDKKVVTEYLESYYRGTMPAPTLLINFTLPEETQDLLQSFLNSWHKLAYQVQLLRPTDGHFAALIRLAEIHVDQELAKQQSLGRALKLFFKLPFEPRTIDCFDISHKQGMFMVGSCVRFTDGKPDKAHFRKFHIKTVHQIDDYASLREIVARRYSDPSQLPDLILIDGGKGQLNAVQDLFPQAEFASLAKREETIFSKRLPAGKKLDQKGFVGQLLIAVRDYAHHFAISFHRSIEKF